MTAQPIETHYAGHRFRSRLEARWAVFFDTLGIRWEYEPQGYLVGLDRRPYLPDFWLPGEKLWVEVKGSEDQLDIELMVAAALPEQGLPTTGRCDGDEAEQTRMLILGPFGTGVTRLTDTNTGEHAGYSQPTHTALTFRKGDLFQAHAWFEDSGIRIMTMDGAVIANDSPQINWETRGSGWGNLVGGGGTISDDAPDARVVEAYRAARSARFEHGESGAQ